MKIKYVIIDDAYPVILSAAHTHKHAASMGGKPTSAGFFSLTYDERDDELRATVFGESVSLGLKPGANDEKILERLFSKYT